MTVSEIKKLLDNLPSASDYPFNEIKVPYINIPANILNVPSQNIGITNEVIFRKVFTHKGIEWNLEDFRILNK